MIAADAVLFAVQAGLQLYGAVRKSYIDATLGRAITLPIPPTDQVDWTSARQYFKADPAFESRYPEGFALANLANMTDEDKARIEELYGEALALEDASKNGPLGGDDITALMTVRQWKDDPNPTALQRVGGTLINIAVDYFRATPGAVSRKSPQGRALHTFLDALDKKDFATAAVERIAPDLMLAVLDSVAANPDLFGGGQNEQLLVKNITETFAASAKDKLGDLSDKKLGEASMWLQLGARAILKGGAETVLNNPNRFLKKANANAVPLIQTVGAAITDMVIGEDSVTFRPLLSEAGLTKIAKASLEGIAANPALLTKNKGLQRILGGVAGSVAKMREPLSKDIFPELARLVLEKSAENLDLIWPARDPAKHLLVTATKTVLAELSRKPAPGQKWRPTLSGAQIVAAAEAAMDEVIDNPDWLIKRAGKRDPILGEAVKAALAALRKVESKRLSAEAGMAVLRAAIGAVAVQIGFLDELAFPDGAKTAIQAALDAVFDIVFAEGADAEKHWKLAANSMVVVVVEEVLDELKGLDMKPAHIAAVRATVTAELDNKRTFDPGKFAEDLHTALENAA